MSSTDLNQARKYIELLRGDVNTPVFWQLFSDVDSDNKDLIPENFSASLDSALPEIQRLQNRGYGVYVTVNPTDGRGRKIENIVEYNWAFADIDNGSKVLVDYPLKPAFITGRDETHGHIYWPVTGCTTVTQYNRMQKQIALYLGSDEQVIDPCRVLRIPGFLHLKDPSAPKTYTVMQDNSAEIDFEYSYEEIISAFKLDEVKSKELEKFVGSRQAYLDGTGYNETPVYRQQMINFAANHAPISVSGSGSLNLIRVASFGYDRGLYAEETTQILWEHFNPRCDPPWQDKEYPMFATYVERAYIFAKNALGCKTATSVKWGDVPEPAGGWDHNKSLVKTSKPDREFTPTEHDIGFVTETTAKMNSALITEKSTSYEHSIKFIGENYPNKTLMRFDSMFYKFNGKHWEEVSDEDMSAQILNKFACWLLSASKVKNILDVMKIQVFERNLKRGMYLDDRSKNQMTSLIMKNGIVEIENGKAVLKPHSSNFFDINMLDYDFDPTATCEEFVSFVEQQWPNNPEMMLQVQELYGLCLIPNRTHGKCALMIGKTRSGKGTHARVISSLVGKHNIASPSMESLIEHDAISSLSKAKVAIIPEANSISHMVKDRVLNRLKSITGGDSVYYNRKYKDGADCDLWPLMIIQANEFPQFADSSGALAGRMWPFPMTVSFAGKEDRGLSDRLCSPQSIAGVLNFALAGLARLIQNGMEVTVCELSKDYVDDIKYDTFPLASFCEECCLMTPAAITYVDDLYMVYQRWCRDKGIKIPIGAVKFTKMLDSSHLLIVKSRESKSTDGVRRRYFFKGVKTNDIAKQKYSEDPQGIVGRFDSVESIHK
jgi:P4 family phage/plasmid primase-like protien